MILYTDIFILPHYMPKMPPDYITTHRDVQGSPVPCTALLTLTMLSSWRSALAPPRQLVWDRVITALRHVCIINVQSSLHENVVFSVCARMGNTAYIIFIMWNSIYGLDALYHLSVVVWLSW